MRAINFFLLVSLSITMLNGCKTKKLSFNPEVINAYINEYVNNQKYDMRLYDPPPPPEWKDSLKHNGRRKPDYIIHKLKPLKIYVDLKVKYDPNFSVNKKLEIGFGFVKSIEPLVQDFLLDETAFSKVSGVILEFTSSEAFFKKYEKIQYNEGYGFFVSFRNLYYSKDGKKAIFEMDFYKRRLNSSSSIIYAEKMNDGTWKFQSELKSMS